MEPVDPIQSAAFMAAYRLGPGEMLRWVRPAFIGERAEFYRAAHPRDHHIPDTMVLMWWNGQLRCNGGLYGKTGFVDVLEYLFNIHATDVEGDQTIPLRGDFVISPQADRTQMLPALETIAGELAGRPVKLNFHELERSTIVLSGEWSGRSVIDLSSDPTDANGDIVCKCRMDSGSLSDFAAKIAELTGKNVVIEATPPRSSIYWRQWQPAWSRAPKGLEDVKKAIARLNEPEILLPYIQSQTGLSARTEMRRCNRLLIE